MMSQDLRAALHAQLGSPVLDARRVPGGDINQAYALRLADGRGLFVKAQSAAPPGLFACEEQGLRWLAQAQALRVPKVIAWSNEAPAFLALEWIEPAARLPDYDERLGRGLAALHHANPGRFGLDHDNYIGILPQENAAASRECWATFYAERRLAPQVARALDRGLLPRTLLAKFDRLVARLETLCGAEEPPARLHGDLWGGNTMIDDRGAPVLIDPAVYGGHREIDLAMMRLFGGFGSRCFAAYDEAYPLAEGHEERVGLYQLYPLLVHLNLFGGSYAERVQHIVEHYA